MYVCMYVCMCVCVYVCVCMYVCMYIFDTNFSGIERTCWATGSWRCYLSGGREFDPRPVHDNSSVPLLVYVRFPVPEHQHQTNKYVCIYILQEPGCCSKLTHTHRCWNWHQCMTDGLPFFQCRLGHVIEIVFFTQVQWHETNVLDNWQLVVLPQSDGTEFNPHWVHNNVSPPLRVYMGFPVQEHQNKTNIHIYVCTVKPVYNDHLMGYFSAFWSSSRWPRAT